MEPKRVLRENYLGMSSTLKDYVGIQAQNFYLDKEMKGCRGDKPKEEGVNDSLVVIQEELEIMRDKTPHKRPNQKEGFQYGEGLRVESNFNIVYGGVRFIGRSLDFEDLSGLESQENRDREEGRSN
jgi:hypothetical protein